MATGRKERLVRWSRIWADKVHPCVFDVRDEAAMDAAIASLPEDFAAIDLLVNNAGLAQGFPPRRRRTSTTGRP